MKLTILALTFSLLGQAAPPPPAPADFAQWERLAPASDRGGLSPDGKWLAYAINRSNGDNEVRVTSIADGATKTVAFGAQPVFSADSRWLAASVGYSEAQQDKMRKDKKPIRRKLALLNLTTAEIVTIDSVESFAFSADGRHLLIRHYGPERPAARGDQDAPPPADPEETPGVTVVVRELASGRDTTFGNVGEAVWQGEGRLLALTIAAEERAGNGVQIYDPASSTLRVLDSASARYLGLTWRRHAADLVVLRSSADEKKDGSNYAVLAWSGVGSEAEKKHEYDPGRDAALGAARRVVAFRRPAWSEDGATVLFGVAAWNDKAPKKDKETDGEAPTVDVWHPRDVDVMPKQKVGASRDRQRSLLAAWTLDAPSSVLLGGDYYEQVVPLKAKNLAYVVSWSASALDRSWGRFGTATIWVIDTVTGERTKVADRVDDRFVRASPEGKYILFYSDGQFSTIDTARRTVTNITRSIATSFVDRESDSTDVQRPWFGLAGWSSGDRDVLLYDKFDVWQVAANGSKAAKLTDGAADQIEYRYADLDPQEEAIDVSKPLYFEITGIWNKKSGYARLSPGASVPEKLLWLDKSVSRLAKAKDAEVYHYVVQSFDDSPDAFVATADLKSGKQVTATNPFQSKYANEENVRQVVP